MIKKIKTSIICILEWMTRQIETSMLSTTGLLCEGITFITPLLP